MITIGDTKSMEASFERMRRARSTFNVVENQTEVTVMAARKRDIRDITSKEDYPKFIHSSKKVHIFLEHPVQSLMIDRQAVENQFFPELGNRGAPPPPRFIALERGLLP
ncbi:hypothetical protein HZU67_02491 [Apis mellifera carnica]|nr:hypothetical protein HZU67_02491 [Apis mellifera carnica]